MTGSAFLQLIVRDSLPLLSALLATSVKVTILLALLFAASWFMKSTSAGLKHLLWLSAIGSVLLVFVLSLRGPLFHLAARPPQVMDGGAFDEVSSTLLPASGTYTRFGGMPPLAAGIWRRASLGKDGSNVWPAIVALIWIAGTFSCWLRILWGRFRLRRLKRAKGNGAGHYGGLVKILARRVGVRGDVSVLESAECATPLTHGIIRPVIVLPSAMRAWAVSRKKSVLLHELRHIKRGDSCTLAVAYAVCSLLWFIPPLWAAYARLYQEQEKACDMAVIESGVKPCDYASCLLDTAQFCREPALIAGLSFAGRRKRILKDRITSIIGGEKSIRKGVVFFSLAALLMGAIVLLSAAGNDAGAKYGKVYLAEYQVRNSDEAGIMDTLIPYEKAFNAHDLGKYFFFFTKDAMLRPCGAGKKYPITDDYCRRQVKGNFTSYGFETFYDPLIMVTGNRAVVKLLVESGYWLADYTIVLRREGQAWFVAEAFYEHERVKSTVKPVS